MGNFVYGAILEQYHLEELKSNLKYSFTMIQDTTKSSKFACYERYY